MGVTTPAVFYPNSFFERPKMERAKTRRPKWRVCLVVFPSVNTKIYQHKSRLPHTASVSGVEYAASL